MPRGQLGVLIARAARHEDWITHWPCAWPKKGVEENSSWTSGWRGVPPGPFHSGAYFGRHVRWGCGQQGREEPGLLRAGRADVGGGVITFWTHDQHAPGTPSSGEQQTTWVQSQCQRLSRCIKGEGAKVELHACLPSGWTQCRDDQGSRGRGGALPRPTGGAGGVELRLETLWEGVKMFWFCQGAGFRCVPGEGTWDRGGRLLLQPIWEARE